MSPLLCCVYHRTPDEVGTYLPGIPCTTPLPTPHTHVPVPMPYFSRAYLHASRVLNDDVLADACILVHNAVLDHAVGADAERHAPLCADLAALLVTLIVVSTNHHCVLGVQVYRVG